jgi:hypothetical protein
MIVGKFQNEDLALDYMSINYKDVEVDELKGREVTKILVKLGFNCFSLLKMGEALRPISIVPENEYRCLYRKEEHYQWKGTVLQFSGKNGQLLYHLLRDVFSPGLLNLFNVCFVRKCKPREPLSIQDFFTHYEKKSAELGKNFDVTSKAKLGFTMFKQRHRRSHHPI